MGLKTCKTQFELAKQRGDNDCMESWKKRYAAHGGDVSDLEIPEENPEEKPEKKKKVK